MAVMHILFYFVKSYPYGIRTYWRALRGGSTSIRSQARHGRPLAGLQPVLHLFVILSLLIPNLGALADETATQTPTATVEATATGTETALPPTETAPVVTTEPEIAVSETPVFTPTVEITSTPEVTPTPSLRDTYLTLETSPTAEPTQAVTATPGASLPIEESLPITLSLSSNPYYVVPGEKVSLAWELAATKLPDGLELVMSLPTGFSPLEIGAGVWDPDTQTLALKVTESKGEVVFSIPVDGIGPYPLSAGLFYYGKALAQAELNLTEEGLTKLESGVGEAQSLDGRVKVYFPEGAATEALAVRVRQPSQENEPPTTLSGHEFDVYAQSLGSKLEVSQFQHPITITVAYDPDNLWGPEEGLKLAYFDEVERRWRILYSWVDEENHLLYATSDHLTVFDYTIQTMETARTPTLDSFQIANFTGAATYSLPIWAPPGPGGLQPDLALSYNSQVVDAAMNKTQASWTGMGWSLDIGYIQRNTNGTKTNYADDTFSIVTNGINSLLLEGSDGYYHTTDESFWRIEYDQVNNTWTAWDKVGNRYFFEETAKLTHYKGQPDSHYRIYCYAQWSKTWQWSLTSVRNIYGQVLTYAYASDEKPMSGCHLNEGYYGGTLAVYPSTITYPNNRYQVKFEKVSRTDYDNEWLSLSTYVPFQRYRLDKVKILYDADLDGQFETGEVIREYDFNFATSDPIFPELTWPAGGKTLTLISVQEYGLDSASLPSTIFSYSDGMHLTEAVNNYGGKIEFEYEPWYDLKSDVTRRYKIYDFGDQPNWSALDDPVTITYPWNEYIQFNGPIMKKFPEYFFMYGGRYKTYLLAEGSGDKWVKAGLKIGQDIQWTPQNPLTVTLDSDLGAEFSIPLTTTAATDAGYMLMDSNNVMVKKLEFYLLPTRYRVIEKSIYDSENGDPQVFTYRYDDAATNDKSHSAAASTDEPYIDERSEFRGHAMVQEEGPYGRVNTTFFHQDDARSGRSNASIVSTQTLWESFDEINTSNWQLNPGSGVITSTRYAGDNVLKSYNPTTSWGTQISRTNGILKDANGYANTIFIQFQVVTTDTQTVLNLQTDADSVPRWGVWVREGRIDAQYNNGGGWQYPKTLVPNLEIGTWYVLQLTIDDQQFYMRVWDREQPDLSGIYECSYPCTMPQEQEWYFKQWAWNGTVYLDTYSEGRIYSLENTAITSSTFITATMPYSNTEAYTGLGITWTRSISTTYLNFNGDGEWSGTRTLYEYNESEQGDAQYGNVTRVLEEEWDPAQGRWKDYRLSLTRYYPNTSGVSLVGLPGFNNTFKCPEDAYNGECSSDYSGSFPQEMKTSSHTYFYDDSTSWSDPPDEGILTGERSLLYFNNEQEYTDPRYNDVRYGYDEWGNRASVETFAEEGTSSTFYNGTPEKTSVAYDAILHTYALSTTNALSQTSLLSYDYRLGLPTAEIDPNGAVTTASYDSFGRLTSLVRPGDTVITPTLTVAYNDLNQSSVDGYQVSAQQRIEGNEYYRIDRFYNGLGRLIQTQTDEAQVQGETADLVSNTWYDAYGNVIRQSVPYTVTETGNLYVTPDTGQAATLTLYDPLGRTQVITATDGTTQTYVYTDTSNIDPDYTENAVTDAEGHTTRSLSDVWGRTRLVVPPTGPGVEYTYDPLGQLTQVERGGATTTLSYNYAGRKTDMDDPDMGVWSYDYDALGNLESQEDARGCTTGLSYDSLNRLTGKSYTGGACNNTPGVTYSYDGFMRNETFDGDSLPYGWSKSSGVSVSGGQLHIPGEGTWGVYAALGNALFDNQEIRFTFLYTNTNAVFGIFIHSGTWGQADYRRWALGVTSGTAFRDYYIGANHYTWTMGTLSSNTWYEGVLALDGDGQLRVVVWPQGNPGAKMERIDNLTPGDWSGRAWTFYTQVNTGTVNLDDYQEYDPNGIGRRSFMRDASGSSEWTYDVRGRVIAETQVISGTGTFITGWSYNSANLPTSMIYPGGNNGQRGEVVEYSYNNQMALNRVFSQDYSTYYLQDTHFDAAGRVTWRAMGADNLGSNPLLVSNFKFYDWDQEGGRLQFIHTGTYTNTTSLLNLVYDYDQVGNIDTIQDYTTGNPQTQSYEYDDLNRLTSASASGGYSGHGNYSESYSYDPDTGNLASKTGLGSYTYDPNHPHAVASTGNGWSYEYDQNGNQVQRVIPQGYVPISDTYDLKYDAENRLVEVKKNNAVVATYVYNADGARVKSTVSGVTTAFVENYAEWNGSVVIKYYYSGATRLAMRNGNTLDYFFGDHLGSTSKRYRASNGTYAIQLYTAWGSSRYSSGALVTKYQFTGQYNESSLGLYYYGARWYDPYLNRWVQPDTIIPNPYNPLDLDRYQYVRSNPVRYKDPSGNTPSQPTWTDADFTFGSIYGVFLSGNWPDEDMKGAVEGVIEEAEKMWQQADLENNPQTPAQVYKAFFGNQIFIWVDGVCRVRGDTCFADVVDAHTIRFWSHYVLDEYGTIAPTPTVNPHLVTHELGHVILKRAAELGIDIYDPDRNNRAGFLTNNYYNPAKWQYSPGNKSWSEIFADMNVAWFFNGWEYEGEYSPEINNAQEAASKSYYLTVTLIMLINYVISK